MINKPLIEQKRKIPLTKDFMTDQKIKDIVYGYIQSNSYLSYDKQRFVYYSDFSNIRKVYNNIMYLRGKYNNDIGFSENSFRKYFKTIRDLYLTKGKVIDLNNKEVDCYYIKEDFERAQLINAETLYYLTVTANMNVIKIYVYLFDRYSFYEKEVKENKRDINDKYQFTLEELTTAIGLSKGNHNKTIAMILECLYNNGLIEYKKIPIELNNGKRTFKFILLQANEQRKGKIIDYDIYD